MTPNFRKLLIFSVLTLAYNTAFAQTRTTTVDVGTICSAVTGAAPRDCEVRNVNRGIYGVQGFNLVTFEIFFDTDGVGGTTGFTFLLQGCSEGLTASDCTTDSDWATIQGESYASGTLTLANGTMSKAAGTDTDAKILWSVAINYVRLRIWDLTAVGETEADDTFTVKAWLANSGAF